MRISCISMKKCHQKTHNFRIQSCRILLALFFWNTLRLAAPSLRYGGYFGDTCLYLFLLPRLPRVLVEKHSEPSIKHHKI